MDQLLSANSEIWRSLEARIGYRFTRRELLREAMTHRSFANEYLVETLSNNERLEFLGDAVLDLIVGQRLIGDYPDCQEGELTRMRAEIVAEPALAELARRLDIGQCLLLGKGEERNGGRDKPSLLADAFEALIGAIFTERGYPGVAEIINPLLDPLLDVSDQRAGLDHKTRLQELLQGRQRELPVYRLVGESGPAHDKTYLVEVCIEDRIHGRGRGRTKKKAEQAAAAAALATFEE